jgi:hypothetical protein
MKILHLAAILLLCAIPHALCAQAGAWADYYDRKLLVEWGDYVIPGFETTLKDSLLPNVPEQFKSRVRGVQLKFDRDRAAAALNFYSRWDDRGNSIIMPVTSMRFYRDFCVAYAWLAHHGYDNGTVSDCLVMLAMKWPSAALRSQPHTPLDLLGIPANALEDPAVMTKTLAIFDSGMTFMLGHELGHIAHRHPHYSDTTAAAARANEAQADEFALSLMGKIAQPPLGAPFLFTMFSHLQLELLESAPTRAQFTHPLNADRIGNVARWLENHGDDFTRRSANRARAASEMKALIASLSRITNGLGDPNVQNLLRLRGLTAQPQGLKPRRPGEPRIPLRAQSGKPSRRWDGVFVGAWITSPGQEIEAEMQLTPTPQSVRGFFTFGAGRAELRGEIEKDELRFTWTIDTENQGTGVLRTSADGTRLVGTWRRENDGYSGTCQLQWKGYPLSAATGTTTALIERETSSTGANETGLGFVGGLFKPVTTASARTPAVTRAELEQAIRAIDRAQNYPELVATLKQHQEILSSDSAIARMNELLADDSLTENQRNQGKLVRAVCQDCKDRGATNAAQLLSLRIIAASALVAKTPRQLADTMEKFSALAPHATPGMARAAIDTPGNKWPPALLPLMQQLVVDWRESGALAAATRMEKAAQGSAIETTPEVPRTGGADASGPVGHWRRTYISFGSAFDENLVLNADGTAEKWTASASGKSGPLTGRWSQQSGQLTVRWNDGTELSKPWSYHGRELLLRTSTQRPATWERIQ